MAKPDLDDGWLAYAHELDAALAAADFTKMERIVLREVFMQLFGLVRRKAATLSPADIAGRVGLRKEHVVRALTSLVRDGVLMRAVRGQYRFVKDYEKWASADGSRRLSRTEIAWCRNAPAVAKSLQMADSDAQNLGAQTGPNATLLGAQTGPIGSGAGGANWSQLGAQTGPMLNNPPTPPHRNGRAEFEIREGGAGADGAAPISDLGSSGPQTLDELIAAATAEFSPKVGGYVKAHGRDIVANFTGHFGCYLAALRIASKQSEEPKNPHAWCRKVGLRFKDEGIPPEAVSLRSGSQHRLPADRATPTADPAKAASKSCEHCSGEGVVTVYHPAPDPARRIRATTPADCVCAWGRVVRSKRSPEDAARIPDLADVLARRCVWLADRP